MVTIALMMILTCPVFADERQGSDQATKTAAEDVASEKAAQKEVALGEETRGKAAPNAAAQDEPTQSSTAPEEFAQSEAGPGNTAPEAAASGNTAPEESAQEEETQNKTAPEKAAAEKREVLVYRACVITSTEAKEGRIFVNWKRRSSAEGYRVYRREAGQTKWLRKKTIDDNRILQYRDGDVADGTTYEYKVLKYNTVVTDEENLSGTVASKIGNGYIADHTYLAAPADLKYTKKNDRITVTWDESPYADRYILKYSRNSLFKNARRVEVKKNRFDITGIDTSKRWYICVRCVNEMARSDWSRSSNYGNQRTSDISYIKVTRKVKKNGIVRRVKMRLDVRIAARQKLYGYDTVQGAASSPKFSYTILLNKSNGRCRIVKMKGGTGKVIRVSKSMYLGHGNGMTYNPDKKILVVAHGKATERVVSVVRSTDLKFLRRVKIKIGKSLCGYNGSTLYKIKTFSGISYVRSKKQYMLTPNEKVGCVYVDENFRPVRYLNLYYKFPNQTQGSHTSGDYIFRSASPKGSGPDNAIFIYDLFGTFLKKIKVPVAGELESLYFIGSKLFGAIYRSRYVTRTKTVKEYYYLKKNGRYVKRHGKKVRRVRKKKVSYQIFYRDSYVIRITGY